MRFVFISSIQGHLFTFMLRFEDGSMVRKSKPQPEDRHKITYYFRNEPPSRTCERLFSFCNESFSHTHYQRYLFVASIRLFMLLWCVPRGWEKYGSVSSSKMASCYFSISKKTFYLLPNDNPISYSLEKEKEMYKKPPYPRRRPGDKANVESKRNE